MKPMPPWICRHRPTQKVAASEQCLGALGMLEVEVRGVLPGEADAAVDLDVLSGGRQVGVHAVCEVAVCSLVLLCRR